MAKSEIIFIQMRYFFSWQENNFMNVTFFVIGMQQLPFTGNNS